jgi:pyridoxamine 5'-phosphate oxidase
MTDPARLRRRYERDQLGDETVAADWLAQFQRWFDAAVSELSIVEANAMQLATVDAAGHPEVRTVLLKGFDERGLVFYTNYDSAKGVALAARPYASAVLAWVALERQIRFSGPVSRVSADETAAYFASRPRGSQLGAWASPQSAVIESRADLDRAEREVAARFPAGTEVPVPPNWGGYRIGPEQVEFWQGRPDRLHDRIRFRRADGEWVRERLAP